MDDNDFQESRNGHIISSVDGFKFDSSYGSTYNKVRAYWFSIGY